MTATNLCELLEWDSAFFNVRIGRVTANRINGADVKEIESWCKSEHVDCLYFLSEIAGDTLELAGEHGFRPVDIRVTLERPIEPVPGPTSDISAVVIRSWEADDVQPLRDIAKVNHRDSRFYQDSHFSRPLSDALFETWIAKSCNGGYADAVLVAEVDKRVCGYVTCQWRNEAQGQIGLLGIAPHAQGKGLGPRLVAESLRLFAEQGKTSVTVVTQGRNLGAQRLYQRSGFITRSIQLWHHRWFNRTSDAGAESDAATGKFINGMTGASGVQQS